jgi:hypothetical protein
MTTMPGGVRMSLDAVRRRCADGSGTEPPRRDKDRSGEHKPDGRGRTGLPPRSNVQMTDDTGIIRKQGWRLFSFRQPDLSSIEPNLDKDCARP